MLSRRLTAGVLAVGSVAVAVATATPAMAAYPSQVRVTAGSLASGTPVTFTAVNQNVLAIKDLRSNVVATCPAGGVTITGTTSVGTNNNNPAATIPTNGTTFTGCKLSNLDVSVSPTQAWKLRANDPSSPSGGPSSGQVTPGEINSVLANIGIGTCTGTFGNGSGGAGTIDNAGGAYGIKYTNGNPSTIQIFTTGTAASSLLGINSTSLSSGCAAGTVKATDKVQLYGLATVSSTTPVNALFNVTAKRTSDGAAGNPLWVAGP